jgi:hypothetical protein
MPRLFKTDIASEANLKVFVTANAWDATESAIWCYTDVQSEADRIVYFAGSQWDADLVIFRTDVQSDAGWINTAKSSLL